MNPDDLILLNQENMKELDDIEKLTKWDKQTNLYDQAQHLRKIYGTLRVLMERAPGEQARGALLLAANVLIQGAEMIENQHAKRIIEEKR